MHSYALKELDVTSPLNVIPRKKNTTQFLNLNCFPKCSMYGIFTYIYPQNYPNVGK